MGNDLLKFLPPEVDLETKSVLKRLVMAHRALAELKGFAETMPNKNILINAITINEAKDSSEIENIITTHDELFKAMGEQVELSMYCTLSLKSCWTARFFI